MTQASLLDAIKEILTSNKAGTQEEIVLALEKKGFDVNQSKVSRLLRKIGAVKVTNEQRHIIYSLPHEPAPPTSKNLLSQLISSIKCNEMMIVIHVNPGSASLIARILDHHRQDLGILGTVAGDDTLFITPTTIKKIQETLQAIQQFIAQLQH